MAISATLSGCGSGDHRSATPPCPGTTFTAGTIVASASATGRPRRQPASGGGQRTPPGAWPEGEVERRSASGLDRVRCEAAFRRRSGRRSRARRWRDRPAVPFPGSSTDISQPDAARGRSTHALRHEVTNGGYAIYTREGSLQKSGPLGELWQGLEPCTSNPQGDPTIVYDELGRWVISMFAFKGDADKTSTTTQCVAMSAGEDPLPLSSWRSWKFDWGEGFGDFPSWACGPGALLRSRRSGTKPDTHSRGNNGSDGNGSGRHRAE